MFCRMTCSYEIYSGLLFFVYHYLECRILHSNKNLQEIPPLESVTNKLCRDARSSSIPASVKEPLAALPHQAKKKHLWIYMSLLPGFCWYSINNITRPGQSVGPRAGWESKEGQTGGNQREAIDGGDEKWRRGMAGWVGGSEGRQSMKGSKMFSKHWSWSWPSITGEHTWHPRAYSIRPSLGFLIILIKGKLWSAAPKCSLLPTSLWMWSSEWIPWSVEVESTTATHS